MKLCHYTTSAIHTFLRSSTSSEVMIDKSLQSATASLARRLKRSSSRVFENPDERLESPSCLFTDLRVATLLGVRGDDGPEIEPLRVFERLDAGEWLLSERDGDCVWDAELFNGRAVEYGLPTVSCSSGRTGRPLSFLPRKIAAVDCRLSLRLVCFGDTLGDCGGQLAV